MVINTRIMFTGKPLLFLSLILAYFVGLTIPQPDSYLYHFCQNNGNYTASSTYRRNLDTVLSSLPSTNNGYGFYNFSYGGQDPDVVNAIALCRGDVELGICRSCVSNSINRLRLDCPNQKDAIVWYDYCMLRYSNAPILNKMETRPGAYTWNINNVTKVVMVEFVWALGPLVDKLKDEAAAGGSDRKFASGNRAGPDFTTIYGLLQCTPDLSQQQCSDCLEGASNDIVSNEFTGKIGARIFRPSCNVRFEIHRFFNDTPVIAPQPSQPLPQPPLPPALSLSPPPPSPPGMKWWIWLIIGAGSLVILVLCCCLVRRKLQVKGKAKTAQKMLFDESRSDTITPSTKYRKGNNHKKEKKMSSELQLFSFESISVATEKFSITNKLGEGGFGLVYKGKLLNGQEIAVKRLSRTSGQGLVEFTNEIKLIAKLQHNNLVRLLGCCIQGEEKVLVYEYMPNKSLDFFLFDPTKKDLLNWTNRFIIIEGIAQGLLYLHKYSRLRVIHRDLKASNVLLDNNLNPKISDFGMAKIFEINESEANTNRVVGTYGYMSPEYAIKGIVSVKTDVFSFGVLLLEIVSSKKNNSCYDLEHPLNLIGLAWELWKEGRGLELLDPALKDSCAPNEVMRCIHMGLLCVQDHAIDRPSMSDVVSMLTNEQMQLPIPQRPAFFIERYETEAAIEDNSVNRSVNKLSISILEAR